MLEVLLLQAFAAGVLGFFAPCSVAMLPAYVAYFLGLKSGVPDGAPVARRFESVAGLGPLVVATGLVVALWAISDLYEVQSGQAQLGPLHSVLLVLGGLILLGGLWLWAPSSRIVAGLTFGLVTTVGILLTFVLVGVVLIVMIGGLSFAQLSAGVLAIGIFLALLGVARLFGLDLAMTLPIQAPKRRNMAGFFLFGLAYGFVSLGCNLPIFGVPVFGALASEGEIGAFLSFLSYGAGVGLLMVVVSVSAATGHGLTAERLRKLVPVLHRVTSLALIAAGLYIVYYYVTVLTA